jgi:hypothetical protein
VSTPLIDEPDEDQGDELARVLRARQHADWRELRFEPMTAPVVGRALERLASRLRESFWHGPLAVAAPAPASGGAVATPGVTSPHAGTKVSPPTAKREPPTHVVDQFHRGDHVGPPAHGRLPRLRPQRRRPVDGGHGPGRLVLALLGADVRALDASVRSWGAVTSSRDEGPLGADRTLSLRGLNEYHVWPTSAAAAWTLLAYGGGGEELLEPFAPDDD